MHFSLPRYLEGGSVYRCVPLDRYMEYLLTGAAILAPTVTADSRNSRADAGLCTALFAYRDWYRLRSDLHTSAFLIVVAAPFNSTLDVYTDRHHEPFHVEVVHVGITA